MNEKMEGLTKGAGSVFPPIFFIRSKIRRIQPFPTFFFFKEINYFDVFIIVHKLKTLAHNVQKAPQYMHRINLFEQTHSNKNTLPADTALEEP